MAVTKQAQVGTDDLEVGERLQVVGEVRRIVPDVEGIADLRPLFKVLPQQPPALCKGLRRGGFDIDAADGVIASG